MPTVFAGQSDLFDEPRQAGCLRHQFGFCSGPCAGFVSEWEYRRRVDTAAAFLEGRTIQPLDRVIAAMQEAAAEARFELAARWREKFEQLEWLLAATSRARTAVDLLTFVYRDPGCTGRPRHLWCRGRGPRFVPGDADRAGGVRGARSGGRGEPLAPGPLPLTRSTILLLMSWFRAHPEALRRTTPLAEWVA
jgi:hypothetical protein